MGFLISLKRKFRQFKKFFQDHQQAFNFIIVFFFFAIVGPLGINQIFYRPPVFPIFKVSWEIGDALSHYGVLVAAVATIVGVYVSIGAAQRSYHEDEINRVKPYIALTGYCTACKVQLFSNNPDIAASNADNQSSYEEYILDKVHVVIENQQILFKRELSDEQKKIVETYGLYLRDTGDHKYVLDSGHYIYLPLKIENVGSGTATNMFIGFYQENTKHRGVNLYTFKVGQVAYCAIFSNDSEETLFGKYVLNLTYGDILGNHYSQKYPIVIGKEGTHYCITIDWSGVQTSDEEKKIHTY